MILLLVFTFYQIVLTSKLVFTEMPISLFVILTEADNIAYNGELWVSVGKGGNTIATSTDGINWTDYYQLSVIIY